MAREKPLTILYAPEDYWSAGDEIRQQICNGCGPKAKFDFVPDTVYGLSIAPACNIHDWMYYCGGDLADKDEADRVFLNNMLRLIEARTKLKTLKSLRRRRARKYYLAVHLFGGPAFWAGKNRPAEEGILWRNRSAI